MSAATSLVGRRGEPYVLPVEAGKIAEFARAVRDRDSVAADMAPPTFLAYAASAYETLDLLEVGDFDLERVLHGEQEYEFRRPLQAGDRLSMVSEVVADETKQGRRGGSMRRVVLETTAHDEATGELVAIARSTLIELGGRGDG